MAERKYNIQNLKPIKTLSKEEAKKRGSKGGKNSVKSRQEKKKLSEFYATALAREYEIEIEPPVVYKGVLVRQAKKKKLSGQQLVDFVFGKMFERCDMVSAKLLENIGEFTEGKKYLFGSDPDKPFEMTINVIGVKPEEK